MLRHLDIFSGIGGFSLGLESTGGFKTVAFCEIEEFPQRVLAKHWPDVPCYEDVRDVGAGRLATDGVGRVDILTGGFPCQDVSLAGARAGLSGERSGLWSELFRVIVEVRPRWAIIENVPGLRTLGSDAVLVDLAGAGYAAWPLVVGAVHAGAPHRRQRVWVVAHANGEQRCTDGRESDARADGRDDLGRVGQDASDSPSLQPRRQQSTRNDTVGQDGAVGRSEWADARNAQGIGRPAQGERGQQEESRTGPDGEGRDAADADSPRLEKHAGERGNTREEQPAVVGGGGLATGREQWDWQRAPEPVLRRMDDGLPCGMDRRKRLKALGNAVVPQIVAAIGLAIMNVEQSSAEKV